MSSKKKVCLECGGEFGNLEVWSSESHTNPRECIKNLRIKMNHMEEEIDSLKNDIRTLIPVS